METETDSIAQKVFSSHKICSSKEIKKIFMCNRTYFEHDDFIWKKFDDSYIKIFYIENIIKEVLTKIEKDIVPILKNNSKNEEESKKYLNESIGKFYEDQIITNIYFILFLILSSIEGGDKIQFSHSLDKNKISSSFFYFIIWLRSYSDERAKYEKDFKKLFLKEEIENLNMRNLFNKTKLKNIMDSNVSSNDNEIIINKIHENNEILDNNIKRNKTYNFSKYSENQQIGKEYYEQFLEILNNNKTDFKEDTEISIYDNLKEENKYTLQKYLIIKDLLNELIKDEESKKGFLALLR